MMVSTNDTSVSKTPATRQAARERRSAAHTSSGSEPLLKIEAAQVRRRPFDYQNSAESRSALFRQNSLSAVNAAAPPQMSYQQVIVVPSRLTLRS